MMMMMIIIMITMMMTMLSLPVLGLVLGLVLVGLGVVLTIEEWPLCLDYIAITYAVYYR